MNLAALHHDIEGRLAQLQSALEELRRQSQVDRNNVELFRTYNRTAGRAEALSDILQAVWTGMGAARYQFSVSGHELLTLDHWFAYTPAAVLGSVVRTLEHHFRHVELLAFTHPHERRWNADVYLSNERTYADSNFRSDRFDLIIQEIA